MSSLLTWNGVPPQKIASLTAEEFQRVIGYGYKDLDERHDYLRIQGNHPIAPFSELVKRVTQGFVLWGATIDPYIKGAVRIKSDHIEKGHTTFPNDANLHSDTNFLHSRISNKIALRFLCVSSMPADFIDLTRHSDMERKLERHHREAYRIYDTALLDEARRDCDVREFSPWDVVLFDGRTPHRPHTAETAHRRHLLSGWVEVVLPSDWRSRIANGDSPSLNLG